MFKRPFVIVACLVLAAIGLWLYLDFRVPSGIAAKGDSGEIIAWLGLAGAVLSLLTAMVGLLQKIIELRSAGDRG